MAWRTIIVSQHAKISYSGQNIVVQTRDGMNQIPVADIQLLLISTTQAVITSAAISQLARQQTKIIFTDDRAEPICETIDYYPSNRTENRLRQQMTWSEDRKQTLWTKITGQKIQAQIQIAELFENDSSELVAELEKLEIGDVTNREAVVARSIFR